MTAVKNSITSRLPPEMNSTNSVITRPMPVGVIGVLGDQLVDHGVPDLDDHGITKPGGLGD